MARWCSTWGDDPIWRAYFSNGLKPPTRWDFNYLSLPQLVSWNLPYFWSIHQPYRGAVVGARTQQTVSELAGSWRHSDAALERFPWETIGKWQGKDGCFLQGKAQCLYGNCNKQRLFSRLEVNYGENWYEILNDSCVLNIEYRVIFVHHDHLANSLWRDSIAAGKTEFLHACC